MTNGKNGKKATAEDKPAVETAPEAVKPTVSPGDFPIIGIGASAGGLDAFSKFLTAMPANTGMATVLVQHLDPSHASNMVELLKRYTKMPVQEATDEVRLEPDHVYMIPPNRTMTITGRNLRLLQQIERPGIAHSIDMFFRSLAADLKDKAICIIMSGTGTDGTLGAKAVKAELGMVMVQDPESASYDGMPRSAITAGVADFVLPAEAMPAKLIEYVEKSYGQRVVRQREIDKDALTLPLILQLIRVRTRRDFSGYKPSTLNRRIERRMALKQIDNAAQYVRFLQEHPAEIDALVKDFLISVTSFFRDPEAFAALKQQLKALMANKPEGAEVRAWIPACATGEEAYTILIIIEEAMEELNKYLAVQVFGTDLDPDAIATARRGTYPAAVSADISDDRLKKFFTGKNDLWQIKREYREKLVFAVQDIIADPPFTRMDVISARNLLIYFDADLQKRMVPLFRYALNQGGILFLGTAETVGEFTELFSPIDRKWKIYRAENRGRRHSFLPANALWLKNHPLPKSLEAIPALRPYAQGRPPEMALLEALPPAVVIDNNQQVIYSHGDLRNYLGFPEGKPNNAIMEAAHPEIRPHLAAALKKAIQENGEAVTDKARIKVDGGSQQVRITVKPIVPAGPGEAGRFIITFRDLPKIQKMRTKSTPETSTREADLEQELQFAKETLRSTIEELGTANEELRSTNEEYQSTNEELQSTNEELETSREELQSINEELSTVNTEHQAKIEELSTINDDMKNLLDSTNIATLFIDNDLKIKRYTPAATGIFNLIPGDIGRPLAHVTSNLKEYDLPARVKRVLDTLIPISQEIQTKDGRWYSARIHPYRTVDNSIAGAVVSCLDINSQKRAENDLKDILDTLRESVIILDGGLKVVLANRRFFETFHATVEEVIGKSIFQIGEQQWNLPELRKLLEEILPKQNEFNDFKVEYDAPKGGHRRLLLNARQVVNESKEPQRKILLAIEDRSGDMP